MRELTKRVVREWNGDSMTFQVHKMNALDGSYLLKFVAEKIIPLIDSFQSIFVDTDEIKSEEEAEAVAKRRTDAILDVIPKALSSISREELFEFEKECLQRVDMMLPAGWQPVMTGDRFGVEDVEYEPILCLILCYEVIAFNFSGFFGGGVLSSLLPPQNTSKQNA